MPKNSNNLKNLLKEADKIFRIKKERNNSEKLYEETLNKSIEEHNQSFVFYIKGKINLIHDEFEDALKNFDEALKIDPKFKEALNYKGVSLSQLNDVEKAIECYDKVIDLDKSFSVAWINKSIIFNHLGKYQEAVEIINEVLTIKNEDFEDLEAVAWLNKGIAFHKQKKESDALNSFNTSISLNPNLPNAWNRKGLLFSDLEKYEEAIKCFEEAINIDPEYFWAWNNLGVAHHRIGEYNKALDCYSKSLQIKPDEERVLSNRIVALVRLKLLDHAEIEKIYLKRKEEINKKSLSKNKKNQMQLELKAQKRVICKLMDNSEQILDKKEEYENSLYYKLKPRDGSLEENFLMVLRRWNSFTPTMNTDTESNRGGGYFLYWKGKGIVIDPGFDFLYNLDECGLRIYDIDAVIITHSHIDHCNDFESILTLIHEYNKNLDNKKEIFDSKVPQQDENEVIGNRKKMEEHNKKLETQKKKIDVFLNLGAMKKFLGWIPIEDDKTDKNDFNLIKTNNPKINHVYPLEKDLTYDLKDYNLKIKVKKALHNEVLTKSYSVGLVFELYGHGKYNKRKPFRIGFTSDTKCDENILKQFSNVDILIPHLGSVEDNDFKLVTDKIHPNHLMLKGVISALSKTNAKLSIISEFGEELGECRAKIVDALNEVFQEEKNLKCITGDIGLKVTIPDLKVNCHYRKINDECKDSGNGINIKNVLEDIDPTNNHKNVIYFCENCKVIHKAKIKEKNN